MVLEKLGSALSDALRKVTGRGFVDKAAVDEFIRDLQRALLQADVDVKLVFELSNRIRERSLNERPAAGMTAKEHMVKTVYDELVSLLGKEAGNVELKKQKILLVGLYGSGKTTSAAKLARFFVRKGLKPALVGCDTFRPAAQEQIIQLGDQIGVPSYAQGKDPSRTASEAIEKFSDRDVVIFDSAGRNALDAGLAGELKNLKDAIKPDEVFLVIPADIGQAAGKQSEEFSRLVGITGVIVTKMDGTAKGGAALSSCSIVNAPIKFIGVGEKVDEFEQYDPKRFVARLIGYGDLQGLLEKAEEIKTPELAKSADSIMSGKYSLQDFYEQIESIKKMGPLKQVMQMIPGLKLPEGVLDVQERQMAKWKNAMDSMTTKEKLNPELIEASRIKRISKGSGLKEDEVKELIKHYDRTKKMMRMMGGKNLKRGGFAQLAKQFGIKV
ncbi:MAG: signal recognition particle protein [Candidatus Aenigmarchaeota archaeon]|nr:signal recognition particle protein [Candidatus Aenigmarchaeota archaeon]